MMAVEPEPRPGLLSRGLGLSLLLHLATLAAIVLLVGRPNPIEQRRGEPLFVELPKVEEPAPHGNPAERASKPSPPRRASPPPRAARSVPPSSPAVARRPAPAIKEMPAPPGPRVASEAAPEAPPEPPVKERPLPLPRPEPRLARPEAPAPPAPRAAPPAALPRPEPRVATPESRAPKELPLPPAGPASPSEPRAAAQPEAPPAPLPPKEAPPVSSAPGSPASPAAAPAAPPAAKPSAPAESAPAGDRLAALRPHSQGGGLGSGHGGIEGEPIPLDSKDPKFHDYFERVRQQIKDKWMYPREAAEKNIGGQLVLDFGIAKDGQLRFLDLKRSSGVAVLDDYAVNAVKLASPFPPIPDAMSRGGIPVRAVFNYIIDVGRASGWLNNFLR